MISPLKSDRKNTHLLSPTLIKMHQARRQTLNQKENHRMSTVAIILMLAVAVQK